MPDMDRVLPYIVLLAKPLGNRHWAAGNSYNVTSNNESIKTSIS